MPNEMTPIVTCHVYPPIPVRSRDWCAFYEGLEESGPYGWGETERAAVCDLQEVSDAQR